MVARFASIAALGAALLSSGCLVVEEHHHVRRDAPDTTAPEPTTSAPVDPILVLVDTDKTMTADPGQGVGVFVEYGSGGAWTVFWTCDTAISGRTCPVSLAFSTDAGFSDVGTEGVPGGYVTQSTDRNLDVATTTGSELHGVTFHTEPGAVVTLDARVGGLEDGSFLFFVQDGQVNGGFNGTLTNPIRFQGTTP